MQSKCETFPAKAFSVKIVHLGKPSTVWSVAAKLLQLKQFLETFLSELFDFKPKF